MTIHLTERGNDHASAQAQRRAGDDVWKSGPGGWDKAGAGFTAVEVEPYNDVVVLSAEGIAAQVASNMEIMATREVLAGASEETKEQVRAAMEKAFAERVEDGVLRLARGFHVVHAVA